MVQTPRKRPSTTRQWFIARPRGMTASSQFSSSRVYTTLMLKQSTTRARLRSTLHASTYSSKTCRPYWSSGVTRTPRTLKETPACTSASNKWLKSKTRWGSRMKRKIRRRWTKKASKFWKTFLKNYCFLAAAATSQTKMGIRRGTFSKKTWVCLIKTRRIVYDTFCPSRNHVAASGWLAR